MILAVQILGTSVSTVVLLVFLYWLALTWYDFSTYGGY